MSNKDKNILKFNKTLIQLLKELETYYPDSGEIITLNNKIKLLKNYSERDILIKICGNQIYKYKDKIEKREETFFNDFDNIKKESDVTEKSNNYELIITLYRMILNIFSKLKKEKKDSLYDKLDMMLQSYIEYYDL